MGIDGATIWFIGDIDLLTLQVHARTEAHGWNCAQSV